MLTELNIGNSTQTRPYSGLVRRWMKTLHFHSLKSSKNLDPGKIFMCGSRKFCQRGSNSDNIFFLNSTEISAHQCQIALKGGFRRHLIWTLQTICHFDGICEILKKKINRLKKSAIYYPGVTACMSKEEMFLDLVINSLHDSPAYCRMLSVCTSVCPSVCTLNCVSATSVKSCF